MNRIISTVLTASALIFGVFLPREGAVAQTAKDLVGTWILASSMLEQGGEKTDYFGSNPDGPIDVRPQRPLFGSNHPFGCS